MKIKIIKSYYDKLVSIFCTEVAKILNKFGVEVIVTSKNLSDDQ